MERLSEKLRDVLGDTINCLSKVQEEVIEKALGCLAAYEETGLEPENIKRDFNEDAVLKLAGQALGVTPDRLRELAQADREGKIPKYTICDTVYDSFGDAWEVTLVELCLLAGNPEWIYRCSRTGTDDYCAIWGFEILTREEAEAALRREQGL